MTVTLANMFRFNRNEVVRNLLQMACVTAHCYQHPETFGPYVRRLSFGGGGPDLRTIIRKALASVLDAEALVTPELEFSDYSDAVMLITLHYATEPVTYAVDKDTGMVNLWAIPKISAA